MIRFAMLRFRTQAVVAFGLLAILAVVLVVTGMRLAHAYDAAVAACKPLGDCQALTLFPSNGYLTASNTMHPLVIAVPCVLGMFWGAPLAAREFETGTFRLAWTQGSTRTRWLAAKLAVVGAASMAVAGLLSLMVTWWSQPIAAAQMGARIDPGIFSESGIAPVGYAAFAFAFGVTAGLLGRRTLPAMAVTLAVFVGVVWFAFPIWVRPHLLPPATTSVPLSAASINGFTLSLDHRTLEVQAATPGIQGAWILSSRLITADGRSAFAIPPTRACGSIMSSMQMCTAHIESLHLRQAVTYQPASRYWPLQWYETGIYLAVSLMLAGLCFLRIRPRRSAEPGVRRLRAVRPAVLDGAP
jgi:hypothetical protein